MVGFVNVQQASKVRKADVQHSLLSEKATELFHHINTRQLRGLDDLIAEDATCHVGALHPMGVAHCTAIIVRQLSIAHVLHLAEKQLQRCC